MRSKIPFLYIKGNVIFVRYNYLIKPIRLFLMVLITNNVWLATSYAGISATTTKAIQGSVPYLTFDGGITKAKTTDELFTIKLSDNQVIKSINDTSSASSPISFAKEADSFADIQTLVTANGTAIAMSSLVVSKFGDDDGDKLHPTNPATGSLTAKWEDNEGTVITDLTAKPSICASPYKLTFSATASTIQTQYGLPASSSYKAGSHSYYFQPKNITPTVCYATPALDNGTGVYAGPESQWDSVKGFKVQDVLTPSKNFPTMGANALFFNFILSGVNAETANWVIETEPADSSVSLTIAAENTTKAKVTLNGPKYKVGDSNIGTFVPTTFKIKANGVYVYSFKLNYWFISQGANASASNANLFCNRLSGYSMPTSPALFTNNTSLNGGNYTRTIGGGLFAEWGAMNSYGSENESGWTSNFYWINKPDGSTKQYNVNSISGSVRSDILTTPRYRATCVAP